MKISPQVKTIFNTVLSALEWVVFAVMVVTFFVIMSPMLPTKQFFATYIVPTGSMEPTVKAGSVVLVQPTDGTTLQKGDVIAFRSPLNPNDTILHRIDEVRDEFGMRTYKTKGDNNNGIDDWTVDPTMIYGKFTLGIPYLGHPIAMMQTPEGYAILVGIPAVFIMFTQIWKIKDGIVEEIQQRRKPAYIPRRIPQLTQNDTYSNKHYIQIHEIRPKTIHTIQIMRSLLLIMGAFSLSSVGIAKAMFVDKSVLDGINITVGNAEAWNAGTNLSPSPTAEPTPTPESSPSPSPSPTATPSSSPIPSVEPSDTPTPTPSPSSTPAPTGDVVINEVYYQVDDDKGIAKNEWIEIYNPTNQAVSLQNWSITDGQGNIKTISADITVPSFSYILISSDSTTWTFWTVSDSIIRTFYGGSVGWLNDTGDSLTLKNTLGEAIDFVAWENFVETWSSNATKGKSVSRQSIAIDTDTPSDWTVLSSPTPGT